MIWFQGRNLAFAVCYFDIEGQYTDLSGITIPAQVGDQREIPVSLDFGYESRSFLFSSTLDRFFFQPTWTNMDYTAGVNTDLQTDLRWRGRTLFHENIKVGNKEIFHQEEIQLVETQPLVHSQFHEVVGVFSFSRESFFMTRRILRLSAKERGGKVQITSLGARNFPWPVFVISIPVSSPQVWSFSSAAVYLGDILLGSDDFVVNPSLLDILIPMSTWSLSLRDRTEFDMDPQSGRLYIVANRFDSVDISVHAMGEDDGLDNRFIGTVRLPNKSLRYPELYAAANIRTSPTLGPMIPLRIRFVNNIDRIWIGKSLLDTYKHIYLDNIHSMIRLVPRTFLTKPSSVHPRSALLVEDVFSNPPSLSNTLIPLNLSPVSPTMLDRGLIPWSFRESVNPRDGLKSYELRFVRVHSLSPLTQTTHTSFRLDHANLVFSASLENGVGLSRTPIPADPRLYLVAEVSVGVREISIRISENGLLLDLPRPAPMAGQKNDESVICSVCVEAIQSGQLHQLLPLCKHKFHAPCIYPWFHNRKQSCPNCRSEIPLARFVNA